MADIRKELTDKITDQDKLVTSTDERESPSSLYDAMRKLKKMSERGRHKPYIGGHRSK